VGFGTRSCMSIAVVVLLSLWMIVPVASSERPTTSGILVQDEVWRGNIRQDFSFPTISYNTLSDNEVGILVQDSSGSSIVKNYFQNNTQRLQGDCESRKWNFLRPFLRNIYL